MLKESGLTVSVGNVWWQSERGSRPGSEGWGTCLLQEPGLPPTCSLFAPATILGRLPSYFLEFVSQLAPLCWFLATGCFCLPWDLCKQCRVVCRLSHFTGHGDVYIHLCPTSRCLWGFVVDSSSKCGQTSFRPYAFLLMDTCVSCSVRMKLLCPFSYRSVHGHTFPFLSGRCVGAQLLR